MFSNMFITVFFIDKSLKTHALFLTSLILTWLYTGIFISVHDCIHNDYTIHGIIMSHYYSFIDYKILRENHFKHHTYSGTQLDPDFSEEKMINWFFSFMKKYSTIKQFVLLGIKYNLYLYFFPKINVFFLTILPPILSALQLFYFGIYIPHNKNNVYEDKNNAYTDYNKSRLFHLLTCFNFGYHHEHHLYPKIQWWYLSPEEK